MVYWFLYGNDKMLLFRQGGRFHVCKGDGVPFRVEGIVHSIGEYKGIECKGAAIVHTEEVPVVGIDSEDDGYIWIGLRESYDLINHSLYRLAGRASELVYWDKNTRFCPACGTATEVKTAISKKCPHCGKEMFPQLSPAILVMIHKGDEILLVHARNFKKPFHSLVAGFVELGETLEECVVREVYEETTLKINHIHYFGSQPWPYPCGIMIGFTADYVSGEICFADKELTEGGFRSRDRLPLLPKRLSLARKMIDSWLEGD